MRSFILKIFTKNKMQFLLQVSLYNTIVAVMFIDKCIGKGLVDSKIILKVTIGGALVL